MAKKSNDTFTTIRTEGAILPADLLRRIALGDSEITGLRPEDYHLLPGEKLGEAATRAWNRLTGAWQAFKQQIEQLSEDDAGTTLTRQRWLLVLFQELGYGRLTMATAHEIDGKTYPVSHKAAEPVPIHLVSFRYDLDRREKGGSGVTRMSPHALVQEFLNRSTDHLWGFLSDGLRLRILRNNVSLTRAAYVEFDLQAMFDGDTYSDFFLLYCLCHQSRVEARPEKPDADTPEQVAIDQPRAKVSPATCWLERWYNTSLTDGVRSLDDLRKGVEQAIETLGGGFLAHGANKDLRERLRSGKLSTLDYYRQILRQVYRMLFLFVAEDRDLLLAADTPETTREVFTKYYSTGRLRELAGRRRGTRHSDLWEQLALVFDKLYAGCPTLGLPALGSFLFSEKATPDLDGARLANTQFLAALRHLCFTTKNDVLQPINYRNLGNEELGSVYESLLEMHPELHVDTAQFSLNVAAGSERKTTGSYYTPSSLVNCLLDSALEPVIDEAIAGKNFDEQERAILALKVCDPACGSGHFLIAAAHRMAKRLAAVRSREEEPSPSDIQHALRDVIGHCIYGVDINPMSVELCKINLWLDSIEPGRPLTFLEHHIQCGNSLLGATPELLEAGIPDEAFTPIEGDDRAYSTAHKRENKAERRTQEKDGQQLLFDAAGSLVLPWERLGDITATFRLLDDAADDTLDAVEEKEQRYRSLTTDQTYLFTKFWADAWTAAFVWRKCPTDGGGFDYPITESIFRRIERSPHDCPPWMRDEIQRLAQEYQFFHWHLAFPEVFHAGSETESGGFDVVLGNPPWERIKLQEKEFFAQRDPEIANAPNAAARRRLIAKLPETNPALWQAFGQAKREAEGASHLVRNSGIFPLCGRGDVNTYTIFAELKRRLLSPTGRVGCIVPSGIATDDTTKFFFQDLMDTGTLRSLYDFENRKGLFPAVDSRMKFCLITMGRGGYSQTSPTDFVFFAHATSDLDDRDRHFTLSADDIAMLNPNTRTCPIFRGRRDAELTKYIYRRVPVLINENDEENGNPWGIRFLRMFDMSNDSHLFRTREELEAEGYVLEGNIFVHPSKSYAQDNPQGCFLPLYESKFFHQFTHRHATLPLGSEVAANHAVEISNNQLEDSSTVIEPRYWAEDNNIKDNIPTVAFRRVTRATDYRTCTFCILPSPCSGDSVFLMLRPNLPVIESALLVANMNAFCQDWVSRNKIGGINLSFYIVQQLSVFTPNTFSIECIWYPLLSLQQWILPRVVELTHTARDLEPFARDCGYDGPPLRWDEERRFEIRAELDAAFFHLYLGTPDQWQESGSPELLQYFPTPRDAVDYIMDTFPIVRRRDIAAHETYRTKDRILEIYDEMAGTIEENTRAKAKGQELTAKYQTRLNPPPGPPSKDGKFIPMDQWDPDNWPPHIHQPKSSPKRDTRPAKPVVIDTAFPSTDLEKVLCAALLDFVQFQPGLTEFEYADAMMLMMQSSRCRKLLTGDDRKNFDRVIRSVASELIENPDGIPPWQQLLRCMEANHSLRISDGTVNIGSRFGKNRDHFPAVSSDFIQLVAKAAERCRELQETASPDDTIMTEVAEEIRTQRSMLITS